MEKYFVVDFYEGAELIFTTNNYKNAYDAAVMFEHDTDGECNIEILDTRNAKDLKKLKICGFIN